MELVLATASAVVALLVKSAVKSMGEKSGAASWEGVKSLVALVRSRFDGDPEAEKSLSELEHKPRESAPQEGLQRMLAAYMLRDQGFRDELVRLVEQADPEPAGGGINASVIGNAHVFNGKVEISGNWNTK